MLQELKSFHSLRDRDHDDVVQDFFVERIAALTIMLLAQATNDASYVRLTRRTAKNWLIDQARTVATGPLRRVIEKVLTQEPEFEQVPAGQEGAGRWRIAGSTGPPWAGDPADLLAAAWAVPNVRVPRWTKGTRRPPIADRDSLVAIASAVLEQSGGNLETAQLVHIFAQRFASALDPLIEPLPEYDDEDDDDAVRPEIASPAPGPHEQLVAAAVAHEIDTAAAEIFQRLTEQERAIVPILNDNASVMAYLGRGRSQSALFVKQLKQKIRDLSGTSADRDEIVASVIAQCGTAPDGRSTR